MSFLASPTSLIGDYIGMESCFDLKEYDHCEIDPSRGKTEIINEEGVACDAVERRRITRQRDQWWEMMKKRNGDLPPPIPSLARTENLPSHMPWVMKRYYTPDGRLIIREEKVRHHEYFRAHRANGRLILHLVPLDHHCVPLPPSHSESVTEEGEEEEPKEYPGEDAGCSDPNGDDAGEGREYSRLDYKISDGEYEDENKDRVDVGCGGGDDDDVIEEEQINREEGLAVDIGSSSCGGMGKGGKCYQFNSGIGSPSSCMFQVPVCALRPVRS
ncbi:uncharacterized protein LOC131162334 [Malania oleifera]|uniref:uncharacterized protein LOC131162334 n=1 Tax=Malania oleifera TaxID=397392 RepID=UPI0025AE40E1|nr:uncharacterized protein LOC131162334 [Malania oleifera]